MGTPSNTIPMIRKFLTLCKCYSKISEINEYQLFFTSQKEWNSPSDSCPYCGAPCDAFHKDGTYERDFITYHHGCVHYHRVPISCVECSSCGHSHALLPSVIIPYSSYSIQFVVSLLFHYYNNTYKSVEALCLHFEIAVSTFYRIYHCFMGDTLFLKGVKAELAYFNSVALISYLSSLSFIEITPLQQLFFASYGYSFLQRRCKLRPKLSSAP